MEEPMRERILHSDHYRLDAASIDLISERVGENLQQAGMERREILRNRLAVECCLEIWNRAFGEETECVLKVCSGAGRRYMKLEVPGLMKNPSDISAAEDGNGSDVQVLIDDAGLLSSLGFVPEYDYINGINTLKIWLPAPEKGKSRVRTGIFLLLGALAVIAKMFCPDAAQFAYDYAIGPVYSVFMRMLTTICGPMILVSVMTSICSMGDTASFGKNGAVMIRRFLVTSLVLVALGGIYSVCFYPVVLTEQGGGGAGIDKIIEMLVEIVPSDIASPFVTGNALQIVFMGVILGVTVLFLSESVPQLTRIIREIHIVIIQLMRFLGRLMPYFMLTAVLKLILQNSFSQIAAILKPTLITWSGCLLMMVEETMAVGIQTGTSVHRLIQNTIPASLIGLTTSSTAAALDKMNEDCTQKLGVSSILTDFGIPLGQVLYKPAAGLSFFICALFAADAAGVPITPAFVVLNIILSWLLSISMAPVAGAMPSCLSILFLQLGIPQDFIALAISLSLLCDNTGTMTNVQLIQEEIYAVQHKLNSSDHR